MKKVIIVHQWMSGAEGDWRPWLRVELEKLGSEVLVPEMPDMDVPEIGKWVSKLTEVAGTPDRNTYFIGHSIGCQAILRYLETVNVKVGGAIFVAGWFTLENLEDEETERIASPWIHTPIDIEKIRKVLPKSTLIISDNDPFGAFEINKQKFSELGSKVVVMHNAGHISETDGYVELPEIMKELNSL